jgi:hypothetical protein
MATESLDTLIEHAFASEDNTIPQKDPTRYEAALQRPGDEHSKIFEKMVRANMGFNVTLEK